MRQHTPNEDLPEETLAPRTPTPVVEASLHVLVVDDDQLILDVVCRALRAEAIRVTPASSVAGTEAVLKRVSAFDVVLLDQRLGEEDGVALLPLLRERVPEAKVLLFTGSHVSKARAALVDGVVPKPTSLGRLAAQLRSISAR